MYHLSNMDCIRSEAGIKQVQRDPVCNGKPILRSTNNYGNLRRGLQPQPRVLHHIVGNSSGCELFVFALIIIMVVSLTLYLAIDFTQQSLHPSLFHGMMQLLFKQQKSSNTPHHILQRRNNRSNNQSKCLRGNNSRAHDMPQQQLMLLIRRLTNLLWHYKTGRTFLRPHAEEINAWLLYNRHGTTQHQNCTSCGLSEGLVFTDTMVSFGMIARLVNKQSAFSWEYDFHRSSHHRSEQHRRRFLVLEPCTCTAFAKSRATTTVQAVGGDVWLALYDAQSEPPAGLYADSKWWWLVLFQRLRANRRPQLKFLKQGRDEVIPTGTHFAFVSSSMALLYVVETDKLSRKTDRMRKSLLERRADFNRLDVMPESLVTRPDNAGVYYQLGIAMLRAGMTDRAKELFRQSLLVDPYHVDAILTLAQMYLTSGSEDVGHKYYIKLIDLNPDDALPYRLLSDYYLFEKYNVFHAYNLLQQGLEYSTNNTILKSRVRLCRFLMDR